MFPQTRLRRNRRAMWIRSILQESIVTVDDLIMPVFIKDCTEKKESISSMPGIYRHSIKSAIDIIQEASQLGIKAFILFPCSDKSIKSTNGEEAYNPDNLICQAVREIKHHVKGVGIIADVALDPYTTHGHDGIFANGEILNDETLEALSQQSLVLAAAGCDIAAPSDMMDGRIGAIRISLDNSGFQNVSILSYAVKYSSSLYKPFRDAIESTVEGSIDKSTYQMDYCNHKEAIYETELDIAEGADLIMVKPSMFYGDIIQTLSKTFDVPVFAYQVSQEYTMLQGNLDQIHESLVSLKRAGATAIATYAALDLVKNGKLTQKL